MKRIQQILSILLVMLLVFTGVSIPEAAKAAGNITVEVTANPGELTGAGSTNVTFAVTGNVGVENVRILTGPGITSPVVIGDIEAGTTREHTLTVSLSADQLGTPLSYSISYEVAGSESYQACSVTVKKKGGNPKLNLTVTSDNKAVEPGGKVTFTYTLQNGGDTLLENITLKDTAVVSGNIAEGLTLNPGQNQQYTKTVTIDKDVTSAATASYTAQGQNGTATATPITISASTAALTITAKADKSEVNQGDEVTFTITVKNTSAVTINDILVKDDAGNEIRKNLSLNPNASTNISHKITVGDNHAYIFTADYVSAGNPTTATSEEVPVTISGSTMFSINVENLTTDLQIPGTVELKFTLVNDGLRPLKNVVIKEEALGDIETIAELPIGTKEVTKTITVETAANLVFTATGTDENGTSYSATSAPIVIALPGEDAPGIDAPNGGGDGLGTFFKVLIIIVILIVVAAIALVVLMIIDKKKRAQRTPPRGGRPGPGGNRPNRERRPRPEGRPQRERPQREHREFIPAAPAEEAGTRRIERVVTPEEAGEQLIHSRENTLRSEGFAAAVSAAAASAPVEEEEEVKVYRPGRRPFNAQNSAHYSMDDPEIAARLEAARRRRFEVTEDTQPKEDASAAAFGAAAAEGISMAWEAPAEPEPQMSEELPHEPIQERPRRAFGQVVQQSARRSEIEDDFEDDFADEPAPTPVRSHRWGKKRRVEEELLDGAPVLDDVLVDDEDSDEEDFIEAPKKKRGLFGRKPKASYAEEDDDLFADAFDPNADDDDDFFSEPAPKAKKAKRERGAKRGRFARKNTRDDFMDDFDDDMDESSFEDFAEEAPVVEEAPVQASAQDDYAYTPRRRSRR
ncbi:MAG: DUF11 domain-containing protein [Clostridiales bacterium]|nr:DUF11 domain-containing protein [Clostridiales bacterium]